jgi:hypothetical protein
MLNPLDTEQQYQNLLFALSQPAVSWKRGMRIVDFLDGLGTHASRYESYVLDALDLLYPLLKAAEPNALSPEELRRPLEVLGRIREALPDVARDERLTGAQDSLRLALCHVLMYVGDARALIAAIDCRYATVTPPWLEEVPGEVLRDRRAMVHFIASRLSDAGPFAFGCIRALLTQWKDPPADDADTVRVPVVERGFGSHADDSQGVLRKVTLRITGPGGPSGDRIETAIAVYGAETIGNSLVEAPVAAARQLLNATAPRLKHRTLTGVVTLDQHPALHEGDSAGLAIAALFYAAALKYANQRLVYRIKAGVALTGVVHPDGTVLPVDPASLVPKTRAIFFSRIDTLVVPRTQLEPVEVEVRLLQERYPGRRLDVIGVAHLREVFFDLRIIHQQVVSRSLHLLRGAWRRRSMLAPLALIVALVAILASILIGPIDRNPVEAVYAGEHLILMNSSADTLATLEVGPVTVVHARGIKGGYRFNTCVCLDTDSDGRNEVIFIEKAWEGTGGVDLLRCWSIVRQQFLWKIQRRRSYTFPQKPEAEGTNYMMNGFTLGDLNADGRRELLLIANHSPSFPGVLTVIDPADGSEHGEYLHTGNIMDLVLVDVDDDGDNEIVGCAVNNAFNMAALFCLDGRGIAGHSPDLPAYEPDSIPPAREQCYLLMPRTVVGESFRSVRDNNAALAVSVEAGNRSISVSVDDGAGIGPSVVLNYAFSFDFRIRHIAQGDTYDAMASDLVRKGVLRSVPDRRYFERLQKAIRYWDGHRWSTDPTSAQQHTFPKPAVLLPALSNE